MEKLYAGSLYVLVGMFPGLNMGINELCVVFPSAHAGFAIKKVRVAPNRMEQKINLNLKEFPASDIRSMMHDNFVF